MKKEKKTKNKNGTNAKDHEQQKESDREKITSKLVHTIIHEVTLPKIKNKKKLYIIKIMIP